LYPHVNSWESAHTVRRGYELNIPLQVIVNPLTSQREVAKEDSFTANFSQEETPRTSSNSGLSPLDRLSFLDLSAENLILMALKPAENDPQQIILRCYESHGKTAELSLHSDLGLNLGDAVDLLERSSATGEFSSKQQILTIQPWKIASFQVLLATNPQLR
jgi:alpha-mannosidase